jgi:hypothetical protein
MVGERTGMSSAEHPALMPEVYRPTAPLGKRLLQLPNMPKSSIARLYHSVATLLPSGEVLIAGSNPNPNVELDPKKPDRT